VVVFACIFFWKQRVPDQEEDLQRGCGKRLPSTKIKKEDATDHSRWRKLIKDVWWSGWVWVGECFFWYQPTWVVPDKGPLNGCVFFLKVFVIEHFYLVISIDKIAFFWCHVLWYILILKCYRVKLTVQQWQFALMALLLLENWSRWSSTEAAVSWINRRWTETGSISDAAGHWWMVQQQWQVTFTASNSSVPN